MKLDQTVVDRVRGSVLLTWNAIGSDIVACCDEVGEDLDPESCMESVLDADYMLHYGGAQGAENHKLVRDLIDEHGYRKVLTFLSNKFRLA